jgi:hypothetical protein
MLGTALSLSKGRSSVECARAQADELAAIGDQDQVVVIGDDAYARHQAVARARLDRQLTSGCERMTTVECDQHTHYIRGIVNRRATHMSIGRW